MSPLAWRISSLVVLAGAAFIRLYQLGLKPMHHDEGVNGYFLMKLYGEGVYEYDPTNYHGPTLYYFALALTKASALLFQESGLSTVAVRLVPVIFGVGTVWLALFLRRNIGAVGALAAAALIALSPGSVYISRYFIHEAQFVFFTLGIVVAALRYYERADPAYLLMAALSAALLFATKETHFISVGVLGLAVAFAALYTRVARKITGPPPEERRRRRGKGKKRAEARNEPLERFGGIENVALWSAIALALFIVISILFYSSFFTNWKGVGGALESLKVWAKTGRSNEHRREFTAYLEWLLRVEAPVLILGTAGAVTALVRRNNRFALFAGAWAFGILTAYSLIPYKTPWLMLNFTVPLAIVGGYAVNELYNFDRSLKLHYAAATLCLAALAVAGTQAVLLNFRYYDDRRYPYVYEHTQRGFLPMLDEIEALANRAGTGKRTEIQILSDQFWPMPWYLREYERAIFWGGLVKDQRIVDVHGQIVICSEAQEVSQRGLLELMLGGRYHRGNSYPLRPGVNLVLYLRNDLAGR